MKCTNCKKNFEEQNLVKTMGYYNKENPVFVYRCVDCTKELYSYYLQNSNEKNKDK